MAMKIVLVGPDNEDNLSIRYLSSALLQQGHRVHLAAFNSRADSARVLRECRNADLVGLSMCFQVRAGEYIELARDLKADGCRLLVMGGHYATCAADELMAHHPAIDIIVLHEGEHALCEIAEHAAGKRDCVDIAGILWRKDGKPARTEPRRAVANLDALPFPDRRGKLHLFAGVPTAYMLGSRGCVAACDYCCIVTLHQQMPGPRYRRRDPAKVAGEMAQLYHERGIRQFIFHDDNFLLPSEKLNHERIDLYQAAWAKEGMTDIGFCIKCRPPDAQREVFRRLREMGLLRVFLGIESSSAAGLASIGRRQTVAESERALEVCLELGISAQYTMMMFHPDATMQTVCSDLDFMRAHGQHALNFCRTEIYAGTPLEQRMVAAGRARGNYLARVYEIADPRAALACQTAIEVFRNRCWNMGGLMERTIGMDHLEAVVDLFYQSAAVDDWKRRARIYQLAVNQDLVALLDEVVAACAMAPGPTDPVFRARIEALKEREQLSREKHLAELDRLQWRLDQAILPSIGLRREADRRLVPSGLMGGIAKHAAAVALAFGLVSGCKHNRGGVRGDPGICEFAAPPLETSHPDGNPPKRDDILPGPKAPHPKPPTPIAPDIIDHDGICEYAAPPLEESPSGGPPR